MEQSRYINRRHVERSREAHKKRLAFAAAFAALWRKRKQAGRDPRGVQILAANAAGFGQGGFSDQTRYNTQRSMATRLMRDKVVIEELKRLGLVYDEMSKGWHDDLAANSAG